MSSARRDFEMQLPSRFRGHALAFGDTDRRDPDDLLAVGDDGERIPQVTRHAGVDQDVLEPFGLVHAERAHAIAWTSRGDSQRQLHAVAVEVPDRIARPEGRRVARARRDEEFRRRRRGDWRGVGEAMTTARLDVQEASLRVATAKEAPLERERQRIEGGAILEHAGRELVDLVLEEIVFITEDLRGLRQQASRRRLEGVDRREKNLSEPVARESRVVIGGIAAWCEAAVREVVLEIAAGDVEQRTGEVVGAAAHGGQAARAAAPKEMEEKGLDLVIAGVTERDDGAASAGRGITQKLVAPVASGGFGVRQGWIGARGEERIPPPVRDVLDEGGVAGAVWAPAVIEVGNGEVERERWRQVAQQGEEREGVGTAGYRDQDLLSRLEDAVQADGAGNAAGKHHGYVAEARIELATYRVWAGCSTTELLRRRASVSLARMSPSFAEIAPRYDALRPLSAGDQARVSAMIGAAGLGADDVVVEVGCGTGRITLPLAGMTRARVVGVDSEERMLEVGRAKDASGRVDWRRGSAYRLPVADGEAALAVMVMVVHLLRRRGSAFREVRRILRPGGRLSLWTFTPDHVRRFYLNEYFPSIPAIDLPRFAEVPVLELELRRAGFGQVAVEVREEERRMGIAEVVDRVRGRYISTLGMLPPLEYRLGLQGLEELLARDRGVVMRQRSEWAVVTAW
jgi:ubiquinone/menaquinone biosynthesis C-methylase UbiE